MKFSEEFAAEWNLSKRTINDLCCKGKIKGAIKENGKWLIPDDTLKPIDKRVTSGKYIKEKGSNSKMLPIGISDYKRAQADYYYVDKTLFIKEIIDRNALVTLFTRPRRFGKTLNMDMLKVFFEKTNEDTSNFFVDKAIWKCSEKYRKQQGKYPLIFLTFKDMKYDTWEDTIYKFKEIIQSEYLRHDELLKSDKLNKKELEQFSNIINVQANLIDLANSLQLLSSLLYKHYNEKTIIIIDEYDTPIHEGYHFGYYDEIIVFMCNFFSTTFKDNQNLAYGFLTGIIKIAQESIFSGLNNLYVNTIMDNEYSQYFGFTALEVKEILDYYGYSAKEKELKNWYDGYLFGYTEIYNPWSVINYVSRGCIPNAYWVNTGKNDILNDGLKTSNTEITQKLYSLFQGEKVLVLIKQNITFKALLEEPSNVYHLLLVSGYLKVINKEIQANNSFLCEILIPNKEIAMVYKDEVLNHLFKIGAIERNTADKIIESLYLHDFKKLQIALSDYLNKVISYFDTSNESFYHGLVLGLISLIDTKYTIKSNREAGEGRYDICLFPKTSKYPGIIIELKSAKDLNESELSKLAHEALLQIEDKKYNSDLKESNIPNILKLGLAFSGKQIAVVTN